MWALIPGGSNWLPGPLAGHLARLQDQATVDQHVLNTG